MDDAIVIRTDADHSTGYGHVMRCLSLAGALRRHRRRALFVMNRADESARELIRRHGHDLYITSAGDDLVAEARELPGGTHAGQTLLLDFSHQHVLRQAARVPVYLDGTRRAFRAVTMLDGLGEGSIADRVARLAVDLLIVPYVGAESSVGAPAGVTARLVGPKYFVFPESFHPFSGRRRRTRRVASRILLTFGGTDPHRITLKALSAVEGLRDRRLEVRVVVGPGFDPTLAEEIRAAAGTSVHAIEVIAAPDNLAEHMAWSDVAIAGSGLTKYELALIGTPSVQLSIDEGHARINEAFAERGSSIHLGVHSRVTVSRLTKTMEDVLADSRARQTMARLGQQLTDGLGTDRIVSRLLGMVPARETVARRGAADPGHRP